MQLACVYGLKWALCCSSPGLIGTNGYHSSPVFMGLNELFCWVRTWKWWWNAYICMENEYKLCCCMHVLCLQTKPLWFIVDCSMFWFIELAKMSEVTKGFSHIPCHTSKWFSLDFGVIKNFLVYKNLWQNVCNRHKRWGKTKHGTRMKLVFCKLGSFRVQ